MSTAVARTPCRAGTGRGRGTPPTDRRLRPPGRRVADPAAGDHAFRRFPSYAL